MTTTYEVRAEKFAEVLLPLFINCKTLRQFERVIHEYNATHMRKLKYAHGVSRIVIIRSDYVIKFDIKPSGSFSDGRAGNCLSERVVYERAEREGMAHLLAKPTIKTCSGRTYSIMPRINGVGNHRRSLYRSLTRDELDWLSDNIYDLHCGNYGFRRGKAVVIDYAWDATI